MGKATDDDVRRILTGDRRYFDDAKVYGLMAEWGVSPGRFARLVIEAGIINAMEAGLPWLLAVTCLGATLGLGCLSVVVILKVLVRG